MYEAFIAAPVASSMAAFGAHYRAATLAPAPPCAPHGCARQCPPNLQDSTSSRLLIRCDCRSRIRFCRLWQHSTCIAYTDNCSFDWDFCNGNWNPNQILIEYFNNIYNRFVAARMLCKIGMLLHTGYRYLRIYNRVSPYGLSQSWYICVLVVGIGSLRIAHILRHPASEKRGMSLAIEIFSTHLEIQIITIKDLPKISSVNLCSDTFLC